MNDFRGPIFVRCPRCADKIILQAVFVPYLKQSAMGRTCIITADVEVNEVLHTCPGPNGV